MAKIHYQGGKVHVRRGQNKSAMLGQKTFVFHALFVSTTSLHYFTKASRGIWFRDGSISRDIGTKNVENE